MAYEKRICQTCGKEYRILNDRGYHKELCVDCRRRLKTREIYQGTAYRQTTEQRVCAICGREYEVTSRANYRRDLCPRCRQNAYTSEYNKRFYDQFKRAKPDERVCRQCGRTFILHKSRTINFDLCPACNMSLYRKEAAKNRGFRPDTTQICPRCGVEFRPLKQTRFRPELCKDCRYEARLADLLNIALEDLPKKTRKPEDSGKETRRPAPQGLAHESKEQAIKKSKLKLVCCECGKTFFSKNKKKLCSACHRRKYEHSGQI